MGFIIDKNIDIVVLGEALVDLVLVFPNSLFKVAGNTGIEDCPVLVC